MFFGLIFKMFCFSILVVFLMLCHVAVMLLNAFCNNSIKITDGWMEHLKTVYTPIANTNIKVVHNIGNEVLQGHTDP